jgi:Protein of unknown function (DUF3455)
MRRILRDAAALLGLSLVVFGTSFAIAQAKDASTKEFPPDVPDAIQVPAGEEVVFYAHATGSQIYSCQPDTGDRFTWTLKGPQAELHDRQDKVIGEHSAGPTWKLKDGSQVTGNAAAHVDALDSESIPWLLVKVASNAGKGALAKVTSIQRVHTKGGKAPAEGCDASHRDAEFKSKYSADYFFFAPAK